LVIEGAAKRAYVKIEFFPVRTLHVGLYRPPPYALLFLPVRGDAWVPRVACYPCGPVARLDQPAVAPNQTLLDKPAVAPGVRIRDVPLTSFLVDT